MCDIHSIPSLGNCRLAPGIDLARSFRSNCASATSCSPCCILIPHLSLFGHTGAVLMTPLLRYQSTISLLQSNPRMSRRCQFIVASFPHCLTNRSLLTGPLLTIPGLPFPSLEALHSNPILLRTQCPGSNIVLVIATDANLLRTIQAVFLYTRYPHASYFRCDARLSAGV
jgi:hypothetical protein